MSSAKQNNVISFEEIVGGRDSSVRVTEDKLIYVTDLISVVTGKDKHQSAEVSNLF